MWRVWRLLVSHAVCGVALRVGRYHWQDLGSNLQRFVVDGLYPLLGPQAGTKLKQVRTTRAMAASSRGMRGMGLRRPVASFHLLAHASLCRSMCAISPRQRAPPWQQDRRARECLALCSRPHALRGRRCVQDVEKVFGSGGAPGKAPDPAWRWTRVDFSPYDFTPGYHLLPA
jgi:hypothetical protein